MSKRVMLLIDILVIVLCLVGMALAQIETPTPMGTATPAMDEWPPAPTPIPTASPSPTPYATVNVGWDMNIEPDIDHYNVLKGRESGQWFDLYPTPGAKPFLNVPLETVGIYYFVVTAVNIAGAESYPSEEVAYNTFTGDALNAWLPHPGVFVDKQGPPLKAEAVSKPKKKARHRPRSAQSGGDESQFVAPSARRVPAKPSHRPPLRRPRGSENNRDRAGAFQSIAVPTDGE